MTSRGSPSGRQDPRARQRPDSSRLRGDLPAVVRQARLLARRRLRVCLGLARTAADVAPPDGARLAVAILPADLELEMLRLAGHVEHRDVRRAAAALLESS